MEENKQGKGIQAMDDENLDAVSGGLVKEGAVKDKKGKWVRGYIVRDETTNKIVGRFKKKSDAKSYDAVYKEMKRNNLIAGK